MATRKGLEMTSDPRVIHYFDDFRGHNPNAFLSNFHAEPMHCHNLTARPAGPVQSKVIGLSWRTGEHLFAALKASMASDFMMVYSQTAPGQAKRRGRRLALRKDWEAVKYDTMVYVVQQKFAPGSVLAKSLIRTKDSMLVEGTEWADRVWGVDLNSRYRPGRNWLGRTLMARRAELRLPDSIVLQLDRSFQMAYWPMMERGVKDTWRS